MWAGLSVCLSPDAVALFNITAVGKQTRAGRHNAERNGRKNVVNGRGCTLIHWQGEGAFIFQYKPVLFCAVKFIHTQMIQVYMST